jgi:hypothetical protein
VPAMPDSPRPGTWAIIRRPGRSETELRFNPAVTLERFGRPQGASMPGLDQSAYTSYHGRGRGPVATGRGAGTSVGVGAAGHTEAAHGRERRGKR